MKKQALLFALCALPIAPHAHADIDLMSKRLQTYGELHGSIDYYDRGKSTATVSEPAGVEITSNSSYIGFKGEIELANYQELAGRNANFAYLEAEADAFK